MITFVGLVSVAWALCLQDYLKGIGQYDTYTDRWTDWFVVLPGLGGFGCLLYVVLHMLYTFCVRWMP